MTEKFCITNTGFIDSKELFPPFYLPFLKSDYLLYETHLTMKHSNFLELMTEFL